MPYPSRANTSTDGKPTKKRRPQSAKSYMGWLLSRQDYSAAALRTKLLSKEFPVEEVDAAIAFAQEHKYQSDERYAQNNAVARSARQGNFRVKQVLMQKGISEELAKAQLETLAPEDERVIRVVRKFEGKPMTQELRQKIYRFLASRGFSGKPIKAAFRHLEEKLTESGVPVEECDDEFLVDD